MLSSLFAGISGLNAHQAALSVIGNNIANVNTVGFKSSRTSFSDILSQSLSGGGQIGRGVKLQTVSPMFTQGSFQSTSNVTDLAIDGNGFFIVENSNGRFYTRAGQFSFDNDGSLVTNDGSTVKGYTIDQNGNTSGSLTDINLSSTSSSPKATESITMAVNLDSSEVVQSSFDITDPESTSNFSSSVTVYDSLGNGHLTTVYFNKTAENSWDWHALVDGSELTGGTEGILEECASGSITFNDSGALDTETIDTSDFDFNSGAQQNQSISLDFGASITTDSGNGLDGTTQFAAASATNFQDQDGYSSGSLQSISIDGEGIVSGMFSNGAAKNLYKVALASFKNDGGLTSVGGNMYAESKDSGLPIIGMANSAGFGNINSSSLELSNVDLSQEFVNLITIQRGFQANSKVITVGDEMLQDLVNLKR